MSIIKKKFIILLSLSILILLNQVYSKSVTHDYVPRNNDIERSPKNILIGSYFGGRSHLKPMLDIAAILIERGYNVNISMSSDHLQILFISLFYFFDIL
jgi:hypothetical protein